jgi:hypothetical protein
MQPTISDKQTMSRVEVLKATNSKKHRGDMKDFVKSGLFSLFRPK